MTSPRNETLSEMLDLEQKEINHVNQLWGSPAYFLIYMPVTALGAYFCCLKTWDWKATKKTQGNILYITTVMYNKNKNLVQQHNCQREIKIRTSNFKGFK